MGTNSKRTKVLSLVSLIGFVFFFVAITNAQTIKVEAESGTLQGTRIESTAEGFSGTGYVTGFEETGDAVIVTVSISKAGKYTLSVGYSAPYGPKDNIVSVNGTMVDTIHFDQLSSFAEAIVGDFDFIAGDNTVGFHQFWGWCFLDYFKVSDIAPRGDFSCTPSAAATGDTIIFDATNTNDPNGTIESYEWNFGDGKSDTGMIVKHVFTSEGLKNITLILTDNDGNSSSIVKQIDISRAEPYSVFSYSTEFPEPSVSVDFDGSLSYDLTGTVDSWEWNFGDGNTASGQTASHIFTAEGNYEVSLTVTNNRGKSDTQTKTLFVYGNSVVLRGPVVLTPNPLTNEKIELAFQVKADYSNPYNSDQVMADAIVTFPGGIDSIVIPCFYYEQGYFQKGDWLVDTTNFGWRARFSVPEAGTYSVKLKYTGKSIVYGNSFDIIVGAGTAKGIVQNESNNNQYYRHTSGEPFYPMGINIGWNNIEGYNKILKNISANHANLFRYWHTPFAQQALEWSENGFYGGLGQYSQEASAMTDSLINLGKELNVYMQLVLFQHGPFSETVNQMWDENPYNIANGGFVKNAEQYFYSDSCKHYTKKLLRYIVARWGYSPNIFAWEFFNEVQFTGSFPSQSAQWFPGVLKWHSEMSQYIESVDPYNHIMTTSAEHDQIPQLDTIKTLDVLQYHLYDVDLINEQKIHDYEFLESLNKAVINGEYGEDVNTADVPIKKQQISLWNSIMTQVPHLMWLWDNYHKEEWGKLFYYPGEFLKDEDLSSLGDLNVLELSVKTSDGSLLSSTGLASDSSIFGVVYDESGGVIDNVKIEDLHVPYGNYDITWYLATSDNMVTLNDVPMFREFNTISLPAAVNEIAFKMKFSSVYGLPIALAGSDQLVSLGATVTLNGSQSFDPSGGSINFNWNLITKPSASTVSVVNVNTPNVQFIPDKSGSYSFVLNVDNGTQSAIADTVVILASTKPVANAGPDITGKPKKYLNLIGSESYDVDGDNLTYLWSVVEKPEGSKPSMFYYDNDTALFTSSTIGTYKVILVVNDGIQDSDADTVVITITESSLTNDALSENILVYPNPATDEINIQIDELKFESGIIELYDLYGRLFLSQQINSKNSDRIKIDLNNAAVINGMYILKLALDNTVVTKRVVIE